MLDSTKSGGYTLVELTLSITITGIIMVSLFAIVTNYFAVITRNNLAVDMTVDSQNLLRSTVEALRYGSGVRQTNTISDPNAPSGGWNTSNSNFVIILAVPVVDTNGDYIIDPDTGSPYNNELVYFKEGVSLHRRILAHTGATGNSLRTTCPQNLASSLCPADTKLIDYIDSMVFTLYNQDDALTSDPLQARSVKIDLTMERDTFGQPLVLDNSIRITLRNTF